MYLKNEHVKSNYYLNKFNLKQKIINFMVTLHAYEMAIRDVKKHKGVDISYPRAVMAAFDLIYPETSGHMNGFDRLIAFVRYQAPSWRSLSLRKRIPLVGNRSQVRL